MSFSVPQRRGLALLLAVVTAAVLILTLKLPGVILAAFVCGALWLFADARPNSSEHAALRASIALTVEDIRGVLEDYATFATSDDAESLADRTLHRPALVDVDCANPTIEAFHYEMHGAQRFLRRLDARVNSPHAETGELESLLKVADERAAELKEAWLAARRAALALGTNYKKEDGR